MKITIKIAANEGCVLTYNCETYVFITPTEVLEFTRKILDGEI